MNSTPALIRESRILEAFQRGDWSMAAALGREAAHEYPEQARFHFLAGIAMRNQGAADIALEHLQAAVRLEPENVDHAVVLAEMLAGMQRLPEAMAVVARVCVPGISNPDALEVLAGIAVASHAHGQALALLERIIALAPQRAAMRFELARQLTFLGDLDRAEEQYRSCIAIDPLHWPAYLGLSELRAQTQADNHLVLLADRMRSHGDQALARLYLGLAMAKEREDLGDHVGALRAASDAKAAWRPRLGYTSARDQQVFDAVVGHGAIAADGDGGSDNDEPIFVIGMPRSGTTLVERILSSHPDVASAGELNCFLVALRDTCGPGVRSQQELLSAMHRTDVDWHGLGERYIALTRTVTGQSRRFIDKLPFNFLYVGLIARALPRARIICMRRDPVDTCVANLFRMFSLASPHYDYAYDLLDIGRYYVMFDRLMAHWRRTLPGRVLEVDYERLVTAQEDTTRTMLAHCGLEWAPACLSFEKNAAPVATASAVQVRRPIHQQSLHRGRRYGALVDPLRQLLRDGGVLVQ